jgi:NAD-dependent SIR2 family protein deacetylase
MSSANSNLKKCNCQKCGQSFEFDFSEFQESGRTDTNIFGQTIDCPSCGKATALTVETPKISEQMIARIVESRKNIEADEQRSSGTFIEIVSRILVLIGLILVVVGYVGEFREADSDNGSAVRQTVCAIRYGSGFITVALGFILWTLNEIRRLK